MTIPSGRRFDFYNNDGIPPKYMIRPNDLEIFSLNLQDLMYSESKSDQKFSYQTLQSLNFIEIKDDKEMDDLHYYIGQAKSNRGL